MTEETVFSKLPFRLGHPLKTPSTAWRNWRIQWESENQFHVLVKESENHYEKEWADSNRQRLVAISKASRGAGLSDCNEMLNTAVAAAVARYVDILPNRFTMLDVGTGTGNAALAVLAEIRSTKSVAAVHLVDPAAKSLDQAKARVLETEFVEEHGVFIHAITDLHLVSLFDKPKFDLIISSAALHHHGYLDPAIRAIAHCLKPGGLLVIGDWHNSLWMDPSRVFDLLSSMSWSEKDADLERFADQYPLSLTPEPDPLLRNANAQISEFWRAYAEIRIVNTPSSEMLEGHRPPEDYQLLLEKSGLRSLCSPESLLPDSVLLCVHVAQKTPI